MLSLQIIIDNHALGTLKHEHGFSLVLHDENETIVFDSGQSDFFISNARELNLNLDQANRFVLSHGHYDHGGSIAKLLDINPTLDIYYHPSATKSRYAIDNDDSRYIGLSNEAIDAIRSYRKDKIHHLTGAIWLNSAIGISGEIPRKYKEEKMDPRFFVDELATIKDSVEDDIAMWVKGKDGLSIIVGCAHSGIINTVEYLMEYTKANTLDTLIGGFHLTNADQNRLDWTIAKLKELPFKRIIPAHCTGDHAANLLKEHFGDRVEQAAAGKEFFIEVMA